MKLKALQEVLKALQEGRLNRRQAAQALIDLGMTADGAWRLLAVA